MKANQTKPSRCAASDLGCWRRDALPRRSSVAALPSALVALLLVLSLSAAHLRAATNLVTSLADAGPGSLRQVMAESAAGDTIVFGVAGSITLFSGELVLDKDLTIAGPDLTNLTISGNHAVRVFLVQTNVTFTVKNLTIANGLSTNGGGIYNDGSTVVLLDVTLVSNLATNASGDACGGGVFNATGGVINATNCGFVQNEARGGAGSAAMVSNYLSGVGFSFAGNGSRGKGGAVSSSGEFNASRCSFVQNRVQGGTGGAGLNYVVYWIPEPFSFPGACGGAADGGAICNLGKIVIEQSLLATNAAAGGMGGAGATGGQAYPCGPHFFGTSGGGGGSARGAALCNEGEANLVNCTLAWNTSTGGPGADGATGGPMYCHGGGFTAGGQGGDGGDGFGAIYNENQSLLLLNCTLARNGGVGGDGGASGGGGYWTYHDPPDNPNPTTITWPAPPAGINGIGVGGIEQTGSLLNTLLAFNSPVNGHRTLADLGYNLSSDMSCAFTNIGSLSNTDAKLGPLADNGGPTLTMALLPGSPAVNAGTTIGAPACDQRGLARPQGLDVDIGAFECAVHCGAFLNQ